MCKHANLLSLIEWHSTATVAYVASVRNVLVSTVISEVYRGFLQREIPSNYAANPLFHIHQHLLFIFHSTIEQMSLVHRLTCNPSF
jgi:hypothetical protein